MSWYDLLNQVVDMSALRVMTPVTACTYNKKSNGFYLRTDLDFELAQ